MGSKKLFPANLSRLKTWYRRENLLNLSCRLQVKSWRTGPSCFPGGRCSHGVFVGVDEKHPNGNIRFLCRCCLGVHQNEGIYTRYTHILFWICTCIIQVHINLYIHVCIYIHTFLYTQMIQCPVVPLPPKVWYLRRPVGAWWYGSVVVVVVSSSSSSSI